MINKAKIRSTISNLITLTCILLLMFLLYVLFAVPYRSLTVIVTPIFIITLILVSECYGRLTNTYYIRKLSDDEWNSILEKKLIHYTDNISEETYNDFLHSGRVLLYGTNKAKSNYVMKLKEKCKPYIWFHLEDTQNPNEPELRSFLFSHMSEQTPRKYKVLIDPAELERDRMFIRPSNGNIVYSGNINANAQIQNFFNWYNQNLYLNIIAWPSILSSLTISTYLCSAHQLMGVFIDKINLRLEERRKTLNKQE